MMSLRLANGAVDPPASVAHSEFSGTMAPSSGPEAEGQNLRARAQNLAPRRWSPDVGTQKLGAQSVGPDAPRQAAVAAGQRRTHLKSDAKAFLADGRRLQDRNQNCAARVPPRPAAFSSW
jgi:hypothetical protein